MRVMVTGAAGFIGYHVAERLLARGDEIIGLDSINDYYDVNIKFARLSRLGLERSRLGEGGRVVSTRYPALTFHRHSIEDDAAMERVFLEARPERVVHLAAQAGVRYSLTNPRAYMKSNYVGFLNILEGCRNGGVSHLVYASSSSVYGLNQHLPFSTSDSVDHPVSLYAASKKSNELMAHSYSHLFTLPTTGLRFFTVYGPWGRPDMALFLFTKAILEGTPIDVFNNGEMSRDFTYVDDIVEGIVRVLDCPPQGNPAWSGERPDPASSRAPYRVFNIGNSSPVRLLDFIQTIERCVGKKAVMNLLPLQPGDVPATWADVADLERAVGYKPNTPLDVGVRSFVDWYRSYFGK